MVTVKTSKKEDAENLANISKRAFETDIFVGCKSVGGPPNYKSVKWHEKMIIQGNLQTIALEDKIIGGVLLFEDKSNREIMYVGRIFIEPKYHKLGYGIEAMKIMEQQNSTIKYWRLETPDWNSRTSSFYKKIGYVEMERKGDSIYFQKIISNL